MSDNTLYYGDNLDILRDYIKDETVDLVYLDPPFNSNASYNVLFAEKDGSGAASQIQAFDDTWHWTLASARLFEDTVEQGGKVADALIAFRTLLGTNDMLAYLTNMAPRLVELRRVLKLTGSIYLHCDPTASHYLKVLLDAVFGVRNFRDEITWKRTFAHGNVGRNYGAIADCIYWYSRSDRYTWNQQYGRFSEEYTERTFKQTDPDGRLWQSVTLRNPGVRPNLHFPYTASNGVTYQPHPNGWACNRERLEQYDREGRLYFPAKPDGALRLKMYRDETPGTKLQNIWNDIPPISAHAQERLGYPTQKPQALLERIISASSNEGDVVLDPFCGCGTTVAAAQKLGRRWLGIDITFLAIALMKQRLADSFGDIPYSVRGEPTTAEDAASLARQNPYQFQWWALGLVGARPVEEKKGADKGIDGRIFFHDEPVGGQSKQIILSVKAGAVSVSQVRDLRGVVERENAALGVLISMFRATRQMQEEATAAGFYSLPWDPDKKYPRLQLFTVGDLLSGWRIDCPPLHQAPATFKKAPKVKGKQAQTVGMDFVRDPDPDDD